MNIKKLLHLFIFGIILFGISSNCFAAKDYNYYGKISISGSIFKTNDHGDALLGAKFKVYDINNTFSYYLEDEGNGLYGLAYYGSNIPQINYREDPNVNYNMVFSMLPSKMQTDVAEYIRTGSTNHLDSDFYEIVNDTYITFLSFLFVEEETAPEGYVRGEKILLPVNVFVERYDDEAAISIEIEDIGGYLKYNKNVDYNNPINYKKSGSYINDLVDCRRLGFHSNALANTGISYIPIILFNERGNVSLKISNYVNNLERYTTTRGNKLNYRIEVENTGSAVSTENIIVTTVPNELEYVSGSASDGGVYNKNNHTITWKVSKINVNEKVSFRYSAIVPKNVVVGANFIGKSSVTSKEIGLIQSRETKVSLINNPKTAAPIAIIVILASMMGVITVVKNHKKEKELDV